MPARRKTLKQFVRDRSFLARRHAPLLESEPLVAGAELRAIQEEYRSQPHESLRREIALRFERAVAGAAPAPDQWLCLYASQGPWWIPWEVGDGDEYQATDPLQLAWQEWDERDGLRWRARRACLHNSDKLELARLGGLPSDDLLVIERLLERLLARTAGLLRLDEPVSDPPGADNLRLGLWPPRGRSADESALAAWMNENPA